MIKSIVLITILIIAAIVDVKTMKIPNILILVGLIAGVILNILTIKLSDWILIVIGTIVILIFGFFRLLGMGDIKLWLVINLFEGLKFSAFSVFIASVLLVVVQSIKDPENFKLAFLATNQLATGQKVVVTDNSPKFAFSPYLLVAVCVLTIIRGLFF